MQPTQRLDEPPTLARQNALPLVQVQNLKKHFTIKKSLFGRGQSFVYAVDDVSFALYPGESFGLVGESGSGKTTTGKLLTRLLKPTAGQILLQDGREHYTDIARFRGKSLKSFRRRAQMIFQDPYESMNPRRTIFDTVGEPLTVQHMGGRLQRLDAVTHMLNAVGLTPASSFLFRYPHELSGGQRQRVAIARALVLNPHLVVADEPTSMLDVSVRAGVMKLMQGLATLMNITYLYITHDLAVARYMCDQIAVMYMGKIVEIAETEELLKNPLHPYTRALLSAVPVPDPTHKRPPVNIGEDAPNPVDPPSRCRFYDRCPVAVSFCKEAPAPALEAQGSGHYAACYRV